MQCSTHVRGSVLGGFLYIGGEKLSGKEQPPMEMKHMICIIAGSDAEEPNVQATHGIVVRKLILDLISGEAMDVILFVPVKDGLGIVIRKFGGGMHG